MIFKSIDSFVMFCIVICRISVGNNYVVSVYNGSNILDQPGFDDSKPISMFFMGYHQNSEAIAVANITNGNTKIGIKRPNSYRKNEEICG